jgi:Ni2+-binding GTPase involved in maturation of urease and hydrogenase
VEFDWDAARKSIESVRPGMQVFRLSAKTGEGMTEYLDFLSANWPNRGRLCMVDSLPSAL